MSYQLGAVLRNECESWAIDQKKTLFMVTCDGDSAFDVTDRDIQVRELYENGENGDTWLYSRALYQNTECAMKMNDNLSRTFEENLGSRQGHKKSSGHYKQYNNPIQNELNDSDLGFPIGKFNISNVAVADDLLGISNSPGNLQIILNKIAKYGRKYCVEFSAKKMKIVVDKYVKIWDNTCRNDGKGAKNVFDLKRAKIQSFLDNAETPEEAELAEALLEAYDTGEIDVLTDTATGETLFTLKEVN